MLFRLGHPKFAYFNLSTRHLRCSLRYFSDEKPKDTNLYESLGIKSSATSNEIKKAYYDLSLKYHPDRNKDNVEAANKFREVTEAYKILGNYGLRKRYDKGLPLPNTKSTERKPIVETPVQFQSFFDSRAGSQKYKSQSPGIGTEDDVSNFRDSNTYMSERARMAEEKFQRSKGQSYLVAVFFLVLMVVVKYMKD